LIGKQKCKRRASRLDPGRRAIPAGCGIGIEQLCQFSQIAAGATAFHAVGYKLQNYGFKRGADCRYLSIRPASTRSNLQARWHMVIRYRRTSLKTLLGITAEKKRLKRELGITAVEKPFRWWGNEKRTVKRRLGYYSPMARFIRYLLGRD
jgi:hypothetical protein